MEIKSTVMLFFLSAVWMFKKFRGSFCFLSLPSSSHPGGVDHFSSSRTCPYTALRSFIIFLKYSVWSLTGCRSKICLVLTHKECWRVYWTANYNYLKASIAFGLGGKISQVEETIPPALRSIPLIHPRLRSSEQPLCSVWGPETDLHQCTHFTCLGAINKNDQGRVLSAVAQSLQWEWVTKHKNSMRIVFDLNENSFAQHTQKKAG